MNLSLAYPGVFLVAATLATGFPAAAHGPSGHHEMAAAVQDEEAMKAQHERMGNFEEAMVDLGKAVIHGDITDAGDHAIRLAGALRGYEKDIPHKNGSRIKEFRAFYGELKKRIAKLAGDAKAGNLLKTSLAYGRVLEACVSCHAKFRD